MFIISLSGTVIATPTPMFNPFRCCSQSVLLSSDSEHPTAILWLLVWSSVLITGYLGLRHRASSERPDPPVTPAVLALGFLPSAGKSWDATPHPFFCHKSYQSACKQLSFAVMPYFRWEGRDTMSVASTAKTDQTRHDFRFVFSLKNNSIDSTVKSSSRISSVQWFMWAPTKALLHSKLAFIKVWNSTMTEAISAQSFFSVEFGKWK